MSVLTNARPEALVSERGEGRPVHVVGGDLTIKISSLDTNGAFTVFEGRTPPLHRHRDQDELGHERGWTITTAIPGGLDLFFEDLESGVPRGAAPEFGKILPVFEKHGLELLGPPLGARTAAASAAD
jgi:hypothetical protein